MDPCSFDNLFSKNVLHVLEKIFISLDYKSYKKCLKVNNEWKGVLTSQSFRMRGKLVFHREILKDTLLLYHAAKEGDRVSVTHDHFIVSEDVYQNNFFMRGLRRIVLSRSKLQN